jgi:hypothetical protein
MVVEQIERVAAGAHTFTFMRAPAADGGDQWPLWCVLSLDVYPFAMLAFPVYGSDQEAH